MGGDDDGLVSGPALLRRLQREVGKAVIGREGALELLLCALLAGGHVLLEDVPGTGKTLMAKSFARVLGLGFKRIQFTPDLLPADVTGSLVLDQSRAEFVFRPGPLFSQVVLVDEVNRATPRTQAAMLEAMEERQVTVDGVTRPLEPPFIVLATQNPVEFQGTFPLPEAQLDRFMLRISQGYPDEAEEALILAGDGGAPATLAPVLGMAELRSLGAQVDGVRVVDDVRRYLLALIRATRTHAQIALGASPRAAVVLLRACRALACLRGRDYVEPDDIKDLLLPVLEHRIVLATEARLKERSVRALLTEILAATPVPVEADAVRGVQHA